MNGLVPWQLHQVMHAPKRNPYLEEDNGHDAHEAAKEADDDLTHAHDHIACPCTFCGSVRDK